jgi:DNA-binding CsgD family transcriptional regulator
MNRPVQHIIVAHKSHIVFHGLSAVFRMGKVNFDAVHAQSLHQVEGYLMSKKFDWVFISPQLIINCEEKFNHLRSKQGVRWVALVSEMLPREMTPLFNDVLYFDDSEANIVAIFEKEPEDSGDGPSSGFDKPMLSERELDVLRLVVKGLSNKEIADKLFISTHTVITHRKNITQKTGIKTVSGLTIFAVVNKLVELDNYF